MAYPLPTHEAQRRIDVREWRALEPWQRDLWLLVLVACQSPGIPVDDRHMQHQLRDIWGRESHTYERLLRDVEG